ncbi:MAG: hypothetical protein CMK59_01675 [Proteobacteria bacterium]|nr:hypothetical protein [Pseudomonadota bacterium]
MSNISLFTTSLKSGVLAGHRSTGYVLIKLQTPVVEEIESSRGALNLSLVLDRSGSMSGIPLREAKRCAQEAIAHLAEGDRVGLVIYDNRVECLSEMLSATSENKEKLNKLIENINCGGSTNLHGGWKKGMEQLIPFKEDNAISRVIILSDGRANIGITDPDQIVAQCSQALEQGISTSTYGLGNGFNEDLMISMAESSGGNSYYGESAEDLIEPFEQEFELLQALTHKNIVLKVKASEDVELTLLNQFYRIKPEKKNEEKGQGVSSSYKMKNMAHGTEAWALFRFETKESPKDLESAFKIFEFNVSYESQDGEKKESETVTCALPVLPSNAYADLVEDAAVRSKVSELEAARIQTEARSAALRSDWDRVDQLLNQARQNAQGNEWLTRIVGGLELLAARRDNARFSKEARYSSLKLRNRSEPTEEMTSSLLSKGESLPSYYRKKTRQGKRN